MIDLVYMDRLANELYNIVPIFFGGLFFTLIGS
jgi:hypothetical protein